MATKKNKMDINSIVSQIIKTKISKTTEQELDPKGVCEGIGNSYSLFHQALNELIDNSIMAEAKDISISISLTKEEDTIIYIDNGKGIEASEKGLKSITTVGKKKDVKERDGDLNEHGFGHNSSCSAIGHTKIFFTKQKDKDISLCFSHPDFNSPKAKMGFGILNKEDTKEVINSLIGSNFKHGVFHVLSSRKIDGKKGLSLFKESKAEQIEEIKYFIFEMEKTYRMALENGVKINFEFKFNNKPLSTHSLKYNKLPGSEFLSVVKSLNNTKAKLTLQIMKSSDVEGTCFETRNSKEERKFFYMHNKLLLVPDSADICFGNSLKDAAYSEVKLFIEVVKGGFATLTNKAGIHNNDALKDLSSIIKSFFMQDVRRVIKSEFQEFERNEYNENVVPSTQDYFKLLRKGDLEKYKEALRTNGKLKSVHDVMLQEEYDRFLIIQDHCGKDKIEVMKEFSTPIGKRFDLLIFNHESKKIILTEVKSNKFNLTHEGQVSTYIKLVEEMYLTNPEYSGYELHLHIIAPDIDKEVKKTFEFIFKNKLKITIKKA